MGIRLNFYYMSCCNNRGLKTFPKLSQQLKSFTLTVANVVAHAASTGNIIASDEIIEKRINICNECPRRTGGRCTLCGCYLNAKAGLQASSCPANKW